MKKNHQHINFLLMVAFTSSVLAQDNTKSERNLAQEALNPIADMVSFPIQYNANFGVGSGNQTQSVITIQPVIPFTLSDDWLLVTRWVLPVIDQPDASGSSSSKFGLGDLAPAFFFVPSSDLIGLPSEFTFGFGPGFQIPTHTDPALGTDEWGAGPTILIEYTKDKLQLGLLAANIWSLGDGSEAVNSMLLEPWAAYSITPEWYLLTDMTISADWNESPSDRWVLPIGGGIGRTFNIGKQALNINLQAYWNAIKPDDGADWSMVFTFQMFFPK